MDWASYGLCRGSPGAVSQVAGDGAVTDDDEREEELLAAPMRGHYRSTWADGAVSGCRAHVKVPRSLIVVSRSKVDYRLSGKLTYRRATVWTC